MAIQLSQIKKPEELEPEDAKQGFLVYQISEEELKTLLTGDIKHIIKVARKNGAVIGYFIAYDMKYYLHQHPEWINEFEENPGVELKQKFQESNVLFSK